MNLAGPAHLPHALRWLAIAATFAGVAYWGLRLWHPEGSEDGGRPGVVAVERAPAALGAAEFARWFEPEAARVDVAVVGLLHGGAREAAVLQVNRAPARVYAVGDMLGPSTVLQAIEADAVVVDQAGATRRIALPKPARTP